MENVFALGGIVFILIGVGIIHQALKTSSFNERQKGQINLIVFLFVVPLIGVLSYVVFL